LLNDPDRRVVEAALDNPALTEQAVASAILADKGAGELTVAAMEHRRWSSRRGVKLALLRSKHLSLARFAAIVPELSLADLRDLTEDARVAPNIRGYVARVVASRKARTDKRKV
jgi:hydroxypyruvate isomerase